MSARSWILWALTIGVAAGPAFAADEAAVLRQRAEQLAAADKCDEALPRARRARELDPNDARSALVEGRCLLRTGLYRDAIAPLTAARELDPALPGVSTDLAQAHFHLDDLDAASAELDRAEQENPDDARMHLYRGLVYSRQARSREAATSFDRASGLDPGLTGIGALYAGRSWASVQERDKAAAALERAIAADPDSEWARAAERELEALDAPYERHIWAQVYGGAEHDSNVTLGNSLDDVIRESLVGPGIDEREDVRGIFGGEIGGELLRDPDQSAGVVGGYDGTAHADFHVFDLQYPWLTTWYDRRLDEDTWLRFQPFGGYAWLETDPFVAHGGATLALSHAFTDDFGGQLFTRVNYNEFLFRIQPDPVIQFFNPSASEEIRRFHNRDGLEAAVGIEGSYLVPDWSTTLRAGTSYNRYQAEGRDWQRHGSYTWIGSVHGLPWGFVLELTGRFYWHPYDHRSSYDPTFIVGPTPSSFASRYLAGFGPERHDEILEGEAELRYPLNEWIELSVHGRYTDHNSNVETFDFDRWIAGGKVTLSWNSTRD